MILETMTRKEMLKEICRDNDELWNSIYAFIGNGGINHLRKNAKFPANVIREYTSKRGTKYLQVLRFLTKRDVFEMTPYEYHCALLETKEGRSMMLRVFDSKSKSVTLVYLRPHVFKRYKERMGFKQEGIDIIKAYYKRNPDMVLHTDYKHKEGDIENDFMLSISDGALFGTKNKDDIGYTVNTFIANDTMQEGYKSKFNKQHNDRLESDAKAWRGYLPDEMLMYNKRKEDTKKK